MNRVYLHVGAPKSGTTYLQRVLRHNADDLAARGVLVAGETHLDLIHSAMVIRQDPRLNNLGERAHTSWQRVVRQIRDFDGDTTIVSYELLANATRQQAAKALADLDGLETHVVVTSRDLGRALPSAWQERLKFALTERLEQWRPPADTVLRSEWGWRTMDPAGVAARWGETLPPDHVHIVTVPRAADPEELWRRFAEACSIGDVPVELPRGAANTSLGVVAAELLRRVNARLVSPLDTNREQALWLRDVLAHQVLAPLGSEPIGLPRELLDDARARYGKARPALEESGYAVHGDLDDLEPSSSGSRTPSEVTDAELLETAERAIVGLLLRLREESRRADAAERDIRERGGLQPADPWGRTRSRVLGLAARPVYAENQRLHSRLDDLETQLGEGRRLQMRVAALTDVITELLLAPGDRDEEALQRRLREYRGRSL